MRTSDKIMAVSQLAEVLGQLRRQGKTIVLCHGCFDLLHIGHIRYLQQAARLGNVLVVTVTPDCYVNKGPHRPAFAESLRAEALAALDCVDYVAINEWPTAVETVALLKPDIYAKGAEFRQNRTPEIIREEAAVAASGGEIVYIEDLTSSSSALINRYLQLFPEEIGSYLADLAQRYGADGILRWLEQAEDVRVLVVGETIIDEYHYCETLQRSAHAPVLATRFLSQERFLSGAVAVANHLAGFCGEVGLVSLLGEQASEEGWIRNQLRSNVAPAFIQKTASPTPTRRQYRELYFSQPMLEVYLMNDEPLTPADSAKLAKLLTGQLARYDMVVVADYGHTMLDQAALELLSTGAGHLSVNVQVDAGNVGYHGLGGYRRADYLCLAEQELRLECHDRRAGVASLVSQVADRLAAGCAVAMRGSRGCVGYGREAGLVEAPALATKVVDRAGAADAFLALSSLCAFRGAPLDIICFLGNVAGAEVVATVGNREALSRLPLRRHVESLLK